MPSRSEHDLKTSTSRAPVTKVAAALFALTLAMAQITHAEESNPLECKKAYEDGYRDGYAAGYREAEGEEPETSTEGGDTPASRAQESQITATRRADAPIGFYGGGTSHTMTLGTHRASIASLSLGLIFNRRWMLGGSFAGTDTFTKDGAIYQVATRGIEGAYLMPIADLVGLRLGIILGTGLIMDEVPRTPGNVRGGASFSMLEPGADLEFYLGPWLRVGVGVSWRFVNKLKLGTVTNTDLGGQSYGASVRIGNF